MLFLIYLLLLVDMKNLCKVGIALLSVIFMFSACTSKADRTIAEVETLLDSLELRLAPDRRVELWDVSVNNDDGIISLEGALANKKVYKEVVTSLDAFFPQLENLLLLLPENGDGRLVNGLVNNSVTHLRREPSSKAELLTQALLGTPVRILKEEDGKRLIQIPDGYLGWVNVNEVHFLEPDELARFRDAKKIIFHSQYGFAYSEPDELSLPVADLVIGCMLSVVSQKGEFYEVDYPDGRRAWVKNEEVIAAEDVFYNELEGSEVVATALGYNGIPYLWGGTSAKNIDCSGLVSNAYYMNGIQLPRDADQQSYCGREITSEFVSTELEAGDLLFFGRKATGERKERVTHVGLYIGEGEFIHAAGYRDRVSINSMDTAQLHFIESYPDIFVRATRIIGEKKNGFMSLAENPYYKEILNAPK
jgi:gamma-D-glutamyl-L-lysine dipeptidyl-peptidase